MNKLNRLFCSLGFAASLLAAGSACATDITGAGATFPYPIYAKWAEAYKAKTNIGLNYQSIGSGGGIKQIQAKTVDFGATDAPLTSDELSKSNLAQFPAVMGGEVAVVNINGVEPGKLKLTGNTLADIYLGKITNWNDPAIAADNKDVKLPDQDITVVHRADGSGTTFIFTNYLSKVSADWKAKVGEGKAVQWPVGTGGKGNEGVASYVQRIKGSIGYVEYAYAKQNKMTYTLLKNHEGQYPNPDDDSFKAAASYATWDSKNGFYEILTDEPGKESWPITGATFILVQMVQDKPEVGTEVLKFFDWAFVNGGKLASELDYVPLPDKLTQLIRTSWKEQVKDASGKAIWK
jgi:phosphate transport system substrate-binding protein